MLKSTIGSHLAPPARPGVGSETITDPAQLEVYRALLAAHPLIAGTPSDAVARILVEQVRFVVYRAGFAIMSAGEAGDRLAIVLGGRCQVFEPPDIETKRASRRVGWVGPGELLGEMSLLSDAPRRHTVVASRDTVLAEVPFASLDALEDPLVRLALRGWLGDVATRRAMTSSGERPRDMTLTVLGLTEGEAGGFAGALADALRALGDDCVVVGRQRFDGLPTALELSTIEQAHTYVIYVATGDDEDWDALIRRQGDRLLLVADALLDPKLRKLDLQAQDAPAPAMLVLLQPPAPHRIQGTARWLDVRPGRFHAHVRRGATRDMQRCARLATGRGRGVVFAGASSQGLGYTGVVEAFEELGFVPDVITGNSSGSFAAIAVASGLGAKKLWAQSETAVAALRPSIRQGTIPVIALSDGSGVTDYCKQEYGDLQMEDLPIPCVVTAVDISLLELRTLDRGPVWRAVRASVSLPIIYPPVVADGVLIDGGALENYPVDQIASLCDRGRILICDLSQDMPPMTDIAEYGAAISGFSALARRFKPFGRRETYPALADIIFRVMCLASMVHRRNLLDRARPNWTFIRPTASAPGLFGISPDETRALIEDCRLHARKVLLSLDDFRPPAGADDAGPG